jgi:hypothetical protein
MNGSGVGVRHTAISIAAGTTLSAILFSMMTVTNGRLRDVFMLPQIPGFFTSAVIYGVHSGGRSFMIVMVVVNSIVYGLVFSCISLLARYWQELR